MPFLFLLNKILMNHSKYLRFDFKYNFNKSMPQSSINEVEPRLEIFVLSKAPTTCCKGIELHLNFDS